MRSVSKVIPLAVSTLVVSGLLWACSKKKDDTNTSAAKAADDGLGFAVMGTLAVKNFALTGKTITHVVALNTETGFSIAAAVDPATGAFKLPLDGDAGELAKFIRADGSVDREKLIAAHPDAASAIEGKTDAEVKELLSEGEEGSGSPEATPWTVTYVDSTKTGKDMIVSRFAANTLDTLSPVSGTNSRLRLGNVTPALDGAAATDISYTDILSGIGMSEATATTFGAIDDISLRYINPDIDNDGILDMPVLDLEGNMTGNQKKFILDFHNRFTFSSPSDNQITPVDLKNRFPDEAAGGIANLTLTYNGTGIIPELEKAEFTAAPTEYTWTFSEAVDLGTSNHCNEAPSSTSLAANTACTKPYTVNPDYERYQLGLEVALPKNGTYELKAGGKTFTWTNVKVSDFSAGVGFVALFTKLNVDSNDKFTGFDFKYMRKTASGWEAASTETLALIVKGKGGFFSMKIDGTNSGKQCGTYVPKTSTGSVAFASAELHCQNDSNGAIEAALKAGLDWSRFSDAGISYDDKLGMRFFF